VSATQLDAAVAVEIQTLAGQNTRCVVGFFGDAGVRGALDEAASKLIRDFTPVSCVVRFLSEGGNGHRQKALDESQILLENFVVIAPLSK